MSNLIIDHFGLTGTGYIYLVQAGYTGPIKIGLAKNVNKRMAELQVGNHMDLKLIAAIGPFNRSIAEQIEKQLHKKFKHKHVRGEWFSRTIDLSAIKEIDIENDSHFCVEIIQE